MAKETRFSASFIAAKRHISLHLVSDQRRRALARAVAESVPVDNKLVVGTTLCWLTLRD